MYLCREFDLMCQSKDVHECIRNGTRWVTCPLKTSPWQNHLVIKVHWVDNEVWLWGSKVLHYKVVKMHWCQQGWDDKASREARCFMPWCCARSKVFKTTFVGCKSLERLMWDETLRLGIICGWIVGYGHGDMVGKILDYLKKNCIETKSKVWIVNFGLS